MKKKSHVLWTQAEKEAVMKHLGSFLSKSYLPGKDACMRCIQNSSPVLDNWHCKNYCKNNLKNPLNILKSLLEEGR